MTLNQNYLAIGQSTDKVVWAIINKKGLLSFGIENIPKHLTAEQQVNYSFNYIYKLIKDNNIMFVINKWELLNKTKRYRAYDTIRLKERLLLACGKANALFIEPDTYGWEIYIAEKSNTKNKLFIIYKTYNANLYALYPNENNKTLTDLANTIIIVEAVALGRISGKNRVLIDYDYKLNKD